MKEKKFGKFPARKTFTQTLYLKDDEYWFNNISVGDGYKVMGPAKITITQFADGGLNLRIENSDERI